MKLYTHIKEILADTKTPVSIYMSIRDKYAGSVLLESSDYHSREGHYSYIGLKAVASFALSNGTIRTKFGKSISEMNIGFDGKAVLDQFNKFKDRFEVKTQTFPFCTAGFFGYSSFDIIKYTENENLSRNKEEAAIPQLLYHFFAMILVFDHRNNSLFIISHAEHEKEVLKQIEQVEKEIEAPSLTSFPFSVKDVEQADVAEEEYKHLVRKAKEHCRLGDVFQLVLSRRFKTKFTGDDLNVYRALKNINPSPYLFYFDMGDFRLFGSSPEAQLLVKDSEAEIHPIAGTYKRSGNVEEDLQKALALKSDAKENSEHIMLVDLARNDLSKYCTNVEVRSFMEIQFYSHVIHLVSHVRGKLKIKNGFEALLGTFPAGTLSGAPKYKALQLINRYEPTAREFYGGCIGFIGLNGDVNHAIMIRTFLSKNATLYYRAGAGIVISSNEESELKEIDNKVSALRKAIRRAEKFDNIAGEKEMVSVLNLETAGS